MHRWIFSGLGMFILCGCDAAGGGGGLAPDGPPQILQVFARERVTVTDGESEWLEIHSRLAYGDHPDIDPEEDDRAVDVAVARDGQRIRVVVDELLRGNYLEEVACADGSWSQVPVGMTFDDVARCSGADLSRCEGLCIGSDGPVGILDTNGDGAFDDTRLIAGTILLTCDGEAVDVDVNKSYWQPSGGQDLSTVGADSLGPAIVFAPAGGMRPGSTCGIAFADSVVDKQGERIPDTGDISFAVEPFQLHASDPEAWAEDVEPTSTATILMNADLDPATVAGAVTVTAGETPVEGVTVAVSEEDAATIVITFPEGQLPGTTYTVTIASGDTGLKDVWDDALAADTTYSWTTIAE
jgi:hypothetical protein